MILYLLLNRVLFFVMNSHQLLFAFLFLDRVPIFAGCYSRGSAQWWLLTLASVLFCLLFNSSFMKCFFFYFCVCLCNFNITCFVFSKYYFVLNFFTFTFRSVCCVSFHISRELMVFSVNPYFAGFFVWWFLLFVCSI